MEVRKVLLSVSAAAGFFAFATVNASAAIVCVGRYAGTRM
jgi:hypothetical protein